MVDGTKERKLKANITIWRKIIKDSYPDTFRILCHNCNWSVGVFGYCPHQKSLQELIDLRSNKFDMELYKKGVEFSG